ncbi:MAG: glycosyltransferase family 2 protein [Chloroflexota bacterium]|nr:glycosyltransferase family 2 protein [Chloroflexota bacterium]
MLPVTIVTPSYNQADYLEQTIRSVLGQNYPNLEYIIVDGGSSDGSVDIIRKYADQLAWWVSEPDSGQAEAINKGLQRASGDIVAWLNSDDLYAPGAIPQAVAEMEKRPHAGMLYGNAVSFDQSGHPLNDLVFDDWGLKGLVAFNIICQPAVFMRREILEQAGYLHESYHFLLDHHLWLRIAQLAEIGHIPSVWAFARHHADAKNVAQAAAFSQDAYRLLDWMKTQPDLAKIIARDQRKVLAAAHRFRARYLLDGGCAWPAIKSYLRSLSLHPQTALVEWQRIVYAALSILGAGWLGAIYYRWQRKKIPASMHALGIKNINTLYEK